MENQLGFASDSDGEDEILMETPLKDPISLEDLLSEAGSVIEPDAAADLESIENNMQQYDSSNVYKFFKEDILDMEDEEDDDDNISPFERMAKKMENVTEDGGVKKQILQHGSGEIVPPGANITVHYNAYLEYADEPFDSSRLRQTPSSFDLGSGQVILGFELAVASMRKKELARFLIEAPYGLGERGCPPRIPGGATCLYVIELLNFMDIGGAGEYFSLPISERKDAPFELVMKALKKTKQEAKSLFETKRYRPAISAYRKAVNILEQYHLKSEEEEKKQQQVLLQLYQNLALCHLKVGQCGKVIMNANDALRIEPNSYKALYLKGKALRQQGEFDRAKTELMKAMALYPKSKEIAEELRKLEKSSSLFHLDEKKMYQRMFTQPDEKVKKGDQAAGESVPLPSANVKDDDLSKLFKEKLTMFVDDPELMEVPYSSASYTSQELNTLESIAKQMGLLVLRKQQANNVHIRVCKRIPS